MHISVQTEQSFNFTNQLWQTEILCGGFRDAELSRDTMTVLQYQSRDVANSRNVTDETS